MGFKGHQSLPGGRVALTKAMTGHWFIERAKLVLFIASALAIILFMLFSWNKRFSGSRSDYLKAEVAYSTWAAQDKHDLALFKQMSDPLKRHPELAAKFGALIAQRLLTLGESKLAQDYAQAALKRTKALLCPYHALFSQNTLLISQGQWKEALEAALELKTLMAADTGLWTQNENSFKAGRALYAYNQVRIASLERELGSFEGEIKAWEDVMDCSGWEGKGPKTFDYAPEAFKMLSDNFQNGDVSFLDFINQRKKELRILIASNAAR